MNVLLSQIIADPAAQPRTSINTQTIEEYTEAMVDGAVFPPLVVFGRDGQYWLADGFHRFYSYTGLGVAEVPCDVREGGLRDAILFSCSANATHGQRRTNDDKRRAVKRLLDDPEWSLWSDREIARRCGVDHKTVSALRPALASGEVPQMERPRLVERGGAVFQQNTAAIGRRFVVDADAAPLPTRLTHVEQLRTAGIEPSRAEQIAQDNANGWISSALWEIERQIEKLPEPDVAARRFPTGHRHTFTSEQLIFLSSWLLKFAAEWKLIEKERTNVAAE